MGPEIRPHGFRFSGFWIAFWLAVPLVGGKAVHWGLPVGEYTWSAWAVDVFVSSGADIAFVLGYGAVVVLVLSGLRTWPRAQRTAGFAASGLGAAFAIYSVAAVQIFDFLRSPLTYTLLYLAGDMRSMRSSVGSFVTPTLVSALVLVPLGYVLSVWLCCRRYAGPTRNARIAAVGVVTAASAWAYWGTAIALGRWSDRSDLLIAKSPHWELLSSVAAEISGGTTVPPIDLSFPPEFLADFRPSKIQPGFKMEPSATGHRRPRNVIEIVLESTGARYMSLYGSRYKTTPNLDAAAQHALVYDNFYTNVGFTANALFALTLSQHPYMTWREYTQEYPAFPGDTLAEALKPQGYRSAFLTSGYLDYVCMDCFLKDRGFDSVEDFVTIGGGVVQSSWGGITEAPLVRRALEWMDQDPEKPFYLKLWTEQSHHPYEPTPGEDLTDFFNGQERPQDDYDLGRYLNTIAQVDRQLGRLFDGLRARGLDRDTILVLTGDHGECFGDPHRTWGHGFRLYEEGIRVPLMIWSPVLFPQGRHTDTVGSHVDINPTILDLLGLKAPPSWEGHSLFASKRPSRAYFYAANDDYLLGLREGKYKFVFNVTRGRDELYDISRDPDEQVNIASAHRELSATFRQRLAAWKHHAAERLNAARKAMPTRPAGWSKAALGPS